ncbi:hypothetical protein SNK03_003130 [Fusarium graminearum]|uniref:Chromosome 1, complete genome n=2 Tax=Gibberella zeae TaxID=5518 RepID=I1S5R9_GIBZE|nr:hypothetical protein FGSG_12190 [Fusarium graminearum PH-1]EYB32032.1 hypothetical protein FG05_12190 [Fusarium graminearum]ESU08204.1 hypothetical protein FGSG_12190 [Fusarium graminearum PH-1]CAF3438370.1 unnamed protein product [Fusarium graminearum]CAF3584646.1 unnamed protein product [Fusarium graminearum]CAG1966275.1 unnamed protein product [Fusarium graminearum]|eukprot:XP_011318689.1 hypothetical protein FGSG_12190 [Fusarium graminearum PH-1]
MESRAGKKLWFELMNGLAKDISGQILPLNELGLSTPPYASGVSEFYRQTIKLSPSNAVFDIHDYYRVSIAPDATVQGGVICNGTADLARSYLINGVTVNAIFAQ